MRELLPPCWVWGGQWDVPAGPVLRSPRYQFRRCLWSCPALNFQTLAPCPEHGVLERHGFLLFAPLVPALPGS